MSKTLLAPAVIGAILLGLAAGTAQAGTIFSDDFNTENGGVGTLNLTALTQWDISGSIDLLGNGLYPAYPGIGLHVDLDGSDLAAGVGTIVTKNSFLFLPGIYLLTFDLGNNPGNPVQPDVNQVRVTLGSLFDETFTVQGAVPLTTVNRLFNVAAPTSANLQFAALGQADYYGPVIDNVSLTNVPEPGTLGLIGGLLPTLALFARRLRRS